MHCLRVVASVEQAIGLEQHGQACLEEAGRGDRSAPCTVGYLHRTEPGGQAVKGRALQGSHAHSGRSGLTLELQGKSFFHGVRFSVQTTSRGSTE